MGCQCSIKDVGLSNLEEIFLNFIIDPTKNEASNEIDKKLAQGLDFFHHDYNSRPIDARLDEKTIKILFLGAGESGKSTIFKQLKILYSTGFSDYERKKHYLSMVYKNTIEGMQVLIKARRSLNIALGDPSLSSAENMILALGWNNPPEVYRVHQENIINLWCDSAYKEVYNRRATFQLFDAANYFLDNVSRTFKEDYIPINDDILRTRIPTTGIIQFEFRYQNALFRLFDVGGQRGERKKWAHCFEDVSALFFVAALSEYDQVLFEDLSKSRLAESLSIFEGLLELPWFINTPIILFLNKSDIFSEKIRTIDLGIYMPAYSGGCDYDAALAFIQAEYIRRCKNPITAIYVHVTSAIITNEIEEVWYNCRQVIIEKVLFGPEGPMLN